MHKMSVDMSKCNPGDRLLLRDGTRAMYLNPCTLDGMDGWHWVKSESYGKLIVDLFGFWTSEVAPCEMDVVEILGQPEHTFFSIEFVGHDKPARSICRECRMINACVYASFRDRAPVTKCDEYQAIGGDK